MAVPINVINLVQKVYHYYPIGIPSISQYYPGYHSIKSILNKKITDIQDEKKTPWLLLVEDISTKFNSYEVFDKGYLQFPSYEFNIQLERGEKGGIGYQCSINLCISLLANFFTLYIAEEYSFLNDLWKDKRIIPPEYKVVYCDLTTKQEYKIFLDDIKKLVKHYFPLHDYINHKVLFDYKIDGGIMYGTDLLDRYSLFEYLFSSRFLFFDLRILE